MAAMLEELILLGVAVIVLITLIINHFSENKNLPPGPFPLPIIGNVHKFAPDSRHVDFMNMEKQYGNVFRLYLGSQLVVVISGTAIKEALITKSNEFAGRPCLHTSKVYSREGKAIVFEDNSLEWKLRHKIVHSAIKLYSSGLLSRLESVVNYEFDLMFKRMELNLGEAFDVTRDIRLAVMNVICALVFGSRYELYDPEFTKLLDMLHTMATIVSCGSVVDVFPWLSFIPLKSMQILNEKLDERDELMQRIYQEHVKANRLDKPQDLTDAMLKAKKEAEEEDSSVTGLITDKDVLLIIGEIFIASTETTASTLCWALLYLLHNPEVQDKLHEELDQVVGPDRQPEVKDKKRLPYMEATITETLRISSLVPLSIPHKTTIDTTLGGYFIPKGTTVIPNLWSLHHDSSVWEDPYKFMPERFLDEDGSFLPPRADRFLPFGSGRRVCIGEPLARIELFVILARLLHCFKLENPPGCSPPTLEPDVGVALMPKPFKVCAVKRHFF